MYPSGIAYPFRFSRSTGGVMRASRAGKVMSDLKALVKSALEERLVRKAVGTVGYSLVLRSNVTKDSAAVEALIIESIIRWIPAIQGLTVSVYDKQLPDGVAVYADIGFYFKETGEPVESTIRLDT